MWPTRKLKEFKSKEEILREGFSKKYKLPKDYFEQFSFSAAQLLHNLELSEGGALIRTYFHDLFCLLQDNDKKIYISDTSFFSYIKDFVFLEQGTNYKTRQGVLLNTYEVDSYLVNNIDLYLKNLDHIINTSKEENLIFYATLGWTSSGRIAWSGNPSVMIRFL